MHRKDLLLEQSAWMEELADSPVVLSHRIRLARNLASVPFPHVLNEENAVEVERRLREALETTTVEQKHLSYLPLKDLTMIEQQVLIEKHLISPALANAKHSRGVALSDDHRLSIMVNEEDHLRLQVLLPGDNLREAFQLATLLDNELEKRLDFAYRESQGYLTACPTNVGTGLRASVMVHLPALVMTKQVQKVLGALANVGLTVRGIYGEGSQAFGHMFQVSNQITLGKSEEDILTHLEAVAGQIVEHELKAREALQQQARIVLEDTVWRARGTLMNARLMTSEDAMHLLSHDRLGVDLGILPKGEESFTKLLVNSLPGCLQYNANKSLDPSERDIERAANLRKAFS